MTQIKEFVNLELMQTVRNLHLNPLIRKVENEIVPTVDALEREMQFTFRDVNLDIPNKTLKFDRSLGGGGKNIELAPILPVFEGIGVEDDKGTGPGTGITLLKLKDATVTRDGSSANVVYDWSKILADNVKDLGVGTIAGGTQPTKFLFFKGAELVYTPGGATTVNIPVPPSQILASMPGQTATAIKEIVLEGDTTSSSISNEKLTINLSAGSVAPVSSDNFKGFFASLGDLKAKVTDPIDGKSFAFAQDSVIGGSFYTPYYYINGSWRALKQDPALTYQAPGDLPQGVFTIKTSEKIKVSDRGELDLEGLSTPQLPSHFKGFFTSMKDLDDAVPNPVANQDWAYIRNSDTGGLLAYRFTVTGSTRAWSIIAPLGSLAVVDRSANPPNYKQAFGIYKDNDWLMDDKGILSLKPINTKTSAQIVDAAGNVTGGDFNTIQFMSGKSYARVQKETLFLNHPQRVINYDSNFEADHNSRDYEGNIFYDETSRCWMGWSIPSVPGAVGAKWTRIAHEDMSLEVKDLVKRVPARTPTVLTGITSDSPFWDYNGLTYIENDDESIPDELKGKSGGYLQTVVKFVEGETVIPVNRIQTLYADDEGGSTYVRRFRGTGSPGAAIGWSPWVRTSFSKKDINAHEDDPAAHKNVIKYHKVTSFTAKFSDFLNQVGPDGTSLGAGTVRGANCGLIADNYGYTEGTDYLEIPYDGSFKFKGELAFSGYKGGSYPVCTWSVIMTIERKGYPNQFQLLKSFTYNHVDSKVKYPPLSFYLSQAPLQVGDKVYIKIKCSDANAVKNAHPNLYFVPIKSYFVLEDLKSFSGGKIAETYRSHLANLNTFGDLEVKAHFPEYNNVGTVRLYGDSIVKLPREMTST